MAFLAEISGDDPCHFASNVNSCFEASTLFNTIGTACEISTDWTLGGIQAAESHVVWH